MHGGTDRDDSGRRTWGPGPHRVRTTYVLSTGFGTRLVSSVRAAGRGRDHPQPIREVSSMTTKVEKSITVDVPVSTAYNQWTQFEEFPQFMGGVKEVKQLDDEQLRWVAEIGGVRREWFAAILEQRPDEKVAWAAVAGATNAGAVYFRPLGPAQTEVRLELEYEPEGLVEKVGDAIHVVGRQATSDLERFKTFIEAKGVESGGWRGEVEGGALGTPGVEEATSQGDS